MSNSNGSGSAPASAGRLAAAFAAIYLIWGSTYLGIRFAVETLPPFLMGGARFLLAGGLLYLGLRWRGLERPARSHWHNAMVVGALLLGVGNGAVNWAEQRIPSGLTALLIAITPMWFALLDWARPGGQRPSLRVTSGIVIGFLGVSLLVGSREILRRQALDPAGVAAVLGASLAWAAGSLYARHTPKPASPLMAVALQMLAGGGILLTTGLLMGEVGRLHPTAISIRSVMAFSYLVVFGSLIAFTAYSWLLKTSTPARISTYAYVNPVIAVLLGWLLGGEELTMRTLWAAAVIVLGVVVITAAQSGVQGRRPGT